MPVGSAGRGTRRIEGARGYVEESFHGSSEAEKNRGIFQPNRERRAKSTTQVSGGNCPPLGGRVAQPFASRLGKDLGWDAVLLKHSGVTRIEIGSCSCSYLPLQVRACSSSPFSDAPKWACDEVAGRIVNRCSGFPRSYGCRRCCGACVLAYPCTSFIPQ